jgi:hypothetical protein
VDFEVGLGTYASSGGTITRTTVFTSSNSNSAVNWGVGTKNIFLTYPADKAVVEDASNNVTIGNNLVVGGTVDGRDVAADGTKLDFVTVTQAVNLDQMETDIAALENGMVYKGDWNAGSGSFPGSGSAQTGWFYYVSGAGTVNGISFAVGDNIVATTDNASTSTYASNWSKHDQTDAVQAVVGLTGSIAKGSLLSALNVEDGADVTDTANVTSAGALMDSEVTNLAQVKAFNSSDYATAAQGTTANNALPKAGGTMSGNIDGNGNKMLFANMYSNLVDLPSATTYHGMFAHVHATGKAYFAHSGAWVPLANESTTLALAGGTMTGDVLYNDNVKAKFGAGSDLQIYHDGSNSIISDQGTGHIKIYANDFRVTNAGNTEQMITANQDGAVTLYYDSVAKLTTTSTGVQVSGNISNATGDFTLDVAGNIKLDADSGLVYLSDGGTDIGLFSVNNQDLNIRNTIADKDIYFQGNDGGSNFTALTLDMSDAGTAIFNHDATFPDGAYVKMGAGADLSINSDGTNGRIFADNGDLTLDVAGDIILDADGDDIQLKAGAFHFASITKPANNGVEFRAIGSDRNMFFKGNDGGSEITALTLDMSAAGAATFNDAVKLGDGNVLSLGVGNDLEIYSDGTNGQIAAQNGNLTLDVSGDIILDADNVGAVHIEDGGTRYGTFFKNGNNFFIESSISDGDIIFRGSDGGSNIVALTLDMSAAGAATFNGAITSGGNITVGGTNNLIVNDNGVAIFGNDGDLSIGNSGVNGLISAPNGDLTLDVAGDINLDADGGDINFKDGGTTFGFMAKSNNDLLLGNLISDGDVLIRGNDGGSNITALTLDMSEGGIATFGSHIELQDNKELRVGNSHDLRIYHYGGNSYVQDSGSGQLRLDTNGTDVRITKTDSEYMGKFIADGGVELFYDNSKKFETTSSGVTVTGSVHASSFGLDSNDYLGWGDNSYLDFVINGGIRARIESDGDIHADGNVIAYSTTISDERLKKDIVKIDNALDKVSQLNGYTFEYLADGKKSAGVIAQEVEKVMPSAITESTLPLKMGEDDKTEYKTVQYDQLHGLMIEAIKELKAEIEELKAR